MVTTGPARKLTVYVSEESRHHGEPIYLAILNYLFREGASGALVAKGVAGFGAHHQLHTTRILEMSERLPVVIVCIETAEKLNALLPGLLGIAGDALVEVQDTTVLKTPARA